jgi:hypothetical protein
VKPAEDVGCQANYTCLIPMRQNLWVGGCEGSILKGEDVAGTCLVQQRRRSGSTGPWEAMGFDPTASQDFDSNATRIGESSCALRLRSALPTEFRIRGRWGSRSTVGGGNLNGKIAISRDRSSPRWYRIYPDCPPPLLDSSHHLRGTQRVSGDCHVVTGCHGLSHHRNRSPHCRAARVGRPQCYPLVLTCSRYLRTATHQHPR